MNNGWITLNREIQKHWIFEDAQYLRMWLILIMNVNWKPGKVKIGKHLFSCETGQSYRSLRSWASLFGCGIFKVNSFFAVLQQDNMILKKIVRKNKHTRTRITVINYDTYQQITKRQLTRQPDTSQTQANTELTSINNVNKKENFKILEKTGLRQGKNKVFFDKEFIGRLGNNGQEFSGTQIYSFIMKHGQFWRNEGELNKAIKQHIKASRGADDHQPHVYANSDRKHRGGGSRLKDLLNFEEPNNVQGTN